MGKIEGYNSMAALGAAFSRGQEARRDQELGNEVPGPILIHAAAKDPLFGISAMTDEAWEKVLLSFGLYETFNRFERFPTGAIIGAAILTDCKLIDQAYHDFTKDLCPEEFLYGDFTVGRYAWRLEKPVLFKNPVPAAGKQRLWEYNGELEEVPQYGKEEKQ